jgi:biopolymer transport protein TolQ
VSADLSFIHLILDASPVVQLIMLSLVGISIWSWTVIFRKRLRIKSARKEADGFETTFWSGTDLTSLYSGVGKEDGAHGMQAIFVAGFREFLRSRSQSDPDAVVGSSRRAMRAALSREMDDLDHQMSFLATAGSTSPYIGLFGTVWGIMHSFRALGDVQYATLSLVAPGIAEALIATAMGLFAAIPAVMAYNRYNDQLERLTGRYETFMEEFSNILQRQAMSRQQVGVGAA